MSQELALSVVVPLFNEVDNIPLLWEELAAVLGELSIPAEVLFVDDASTDKSGDAIRVVMTRDARVRLLTLNKNAGLTAAFHAGYAAAQGRIVVTLDADLQNDPRDVPRLLDVLRGGADAAVGWRRERKDPWTRRVSSRVANVVRDWVTGDSVIDSACSLRAVRRECLRAIPPYAGMHRFVPTLLRMAGYRVVEVPVNHRPRRFGQSKFGIGNRALCAFTDLLVVRWMGQRGLRYHAVEDGTADDTSRVGSRRKASVGLSGGRGSMSDKNTPWRRSPMVRRLARIAVIPVALVAGAAGFEGLESFAVAPRFGVRAPGPDARAAMSEHVVTARGAGVVEVGHGSIMLRAWAPAPAISILREGATPLTIRLLNVPGRVRLHEAADVVETTEGSSRLISIGGAGRRDLRYVAPSNGAAFAALGDTGSSDTFVQALRTATAIGCDFFLVLGDLFYRDEDVPLVRAVLERASLPVYVVRGHHDYYTARRRASLAALGPSFYAFSYGGAGFVVLDSGYDLVPGVAIESVQYEWLRRTFLLPLGNPLLVATHVSPISLVGEKRRRQMLDSTHAARLAHDFEQGGVRLLLASHRHTHRLDVHHGVTYVTSGEGKVPREEHPVMVIVTVQEGEVRQEFVPIWPDTPTGR